MIYAGFGMLAVAMPMAAMAVGHFYHLCPLDRGRSACWLLWLGLVAAIEALLIGLATLYWAWHGLEWR